MKHYDYLRACMGLSLPIFSNISGNPERLSDESMQTHYFDDHQFFLICSDYSLSARKKNMTQVQPMPKKGIAFPNMTVDV